MEVRTRSKTAVASAAAAAAPVSDTTTHKKRKELMDVTHEVNAKRNKVDSPVAASELSPPFVVTAASSSSSDSDKDVKTPSPTKDAAGTVTTATSSNGSGDKATHNTSGGGERAAAHEWNDDERREEKRLARMILRHGSNGDYKILEHLAALVFVAEHLSTGEKRVIKFFKPRQQSPNKIPLEVDAEFDAFCLMGSKYVPTYLHGYDSWPVKDRMLIALIYEKFDCNLRQYSGSHKLKDKPDVIRKVMYQILKGLEAAHKEYHCHRDLKPDNVFVNINGPEVKIGDWGSSREIVLEDSEDITLQMITLWYRPPEVVFEYPYGPKVDIWSAACIFYELTLNKLLFEAADTIAQTTNFRDEFGDEALSMYMYEEGAFAFKSKPHLKGFMRQQWPQTTDEQRIAYDLFTHMLHPDPSQRYSATDCLNHPYFNELRSAEDSASAAASSSSSSPVTPPPSSK